MNSFTVSQLLGGCEPVNHQHQVASVTLLPMAMPHLSAIVHQIQHFFTRSYSSFCQAWRLEGKTNGKSSAITASCLEQWCPKQDAVSLPTSWSPNPLAPLRIMFHTLLALFESESRHFRMPQWFTQGHHQQNKKTSGNYLLLFGFRQAASKSRICSL